MNQARYAIPAKLHMKALEIKRSRFVCRLQHTPTTAQAKAFVDSVKKQFPDASHNCWAFQAGPPGDSRDIGCSDDGEPHGTAGKPILNVLLHATVGEITAVVTRYFGGTKLGTGGLSRAYAEAVKLAIVSLPQTEKICYNRFQICAEYCHWPQIELLLKRYAAEEISAQYSASVRATFALDMQSFAAFEKRFLNLTHGQGVIASL